MNNGAVFGTT